MSGRRVEGTNIVGVKLVGLDLDGTLLNPDGNIVPVTRRHLGALFRRGMLLAIVTGRPMEEVLRLLETNGMTPEGGYPQYVICEERDIYTLAAPEGGEAYKPWKERNDELLDRERRLLPTGNALVQDLAAKWNVSFFVNNSVLQQRRGFVEIMFPSPAEAERCTAHLEKLAADTDLHPVCNNRGISLRRRNTGKGPTLKELVAFLGLAASEVLVMGDSYNDLSMLTQGFRSATTANAAEKIKQTVLDGGGYVSPLEASEGVGDALGRIFNL